MKGDWTREVLFCCILCRCIFELCLVEYNYFCTVLFISISQVIGCGDHRRKGVDCVGWSVNLCSNSSVLHYSGAETRRHWRWVSWVCMWCMLCVSAQSTHKRQCPGHWEVRSVHVMTSSACQTARPPTVISVRRRWYASIVESSSPSSSTTALTVNGTSSLRTPSTWRTSDITGRLEPTSLFDRWTLPVKAFGVTVIVPD